MDANPRTLVALDASCLLCRAPFGRGPRENDMLIPAAVRQLDGEIVFIMLCPRCQERVSLAELRRTEAAERAGARRRRKPRG